MKDCEMQLNAFEASLHRAAVLVKDWGGRRLRDGRSLRDLLMVDGLSIWDVMSVELALYLVPDGLSIRVKRRTWRQLLIPYLRPIKYAIWRPSELSCADCSRWPSGKTALFLGFSDYLARDIFHSIMELMMQEGRIAPVLLSDHQEMHPTIKHVHSMNRHRTQVCIDKSINIQKLISRAINQLVRQKECRAIFSENGFSLWSQLKQSIKRAFKIHAGYILPDVIAVASHILGEHKPSVIISIDTADPITRIYSLIGKKLGIPTVQIQSGAVGPEATEWQFLLDDLVMAQGKQSEEYFLYHGVSNDKILVTGSPRYDGLSSAPKEAVDKIKMRFDIKEGDKIILLASSYSLEIFENNLAEVTSLLIEMKKSVFFCASSFSNITLIVKPHPLEDVEETRSLSSGKNIVFADPKEDIRPLISACDAFVTFGSTSTLEGLILAKPTICPSFPGWIISDNFTKTGAVPAPQSIEELMQLFGEITNDGGGGITKRHQAARIKFLETVVLDGGGGASRRIVDSLYKISGC